MVGAIEVILLVFALSGISESYIFVVGLYILSISQKKWRGQIVQEKNRQGYSGGIVCTFVRCGGGGQ